jgi:uncharacterized membrane protein YccF (DUF307 family)
MSTNFTQSSYSKTVTIIYLPFQVACYVIELIMIRYFYKTGMEFSTILKDEENINPNKARLLFGGVSVILVLGKWDLYISASMV